MINQTSIPSLQCSETISLDIEEHASFFPALQRLIIEWKMQSVDVSEP